MGGVQALPIVLGKKDRGILMKLHSRSSTKLLCSVSLYTGLMLLSACQFKSPSIEEQNYLVTKGAFPSGAPGWLAPSSAAALGGGQSVGGIIPQSTADANRMRSAVFTAEEAGSNDATYKPVAAIANEKKAAAVEAEPNSPLHRIVKSCPTIESEVSDALTTTDLRQRIGKWESLTVRCDGSSDLWVWLGKDYSKDKQFVKAGRCYERALIIDSSNKEAQTLLDENRSVLNAKPAEGKSGSQK